jgi:hypothetical protein
MTETRTPIEQDPILGSEAALDAFIAAFLAGTFPGELWHHREHIIMGGWHLLRYSEAETIERIREAIKRYRIARGGVNDDTSGYHETLTLFWIRLSAAALAQQPTGLSERQRLKLLADDLGAQTQLFAEYYSFDVLNSTPARLNWVEPDLRPLPIL